MSIKAKWIAALRSGKYKQGKNQLRNPDDTFCCLGVACDVLNPEGWVRVEDSYRNKWKFYHEGKEAYLYLEEIRDTVGITEDQEMELTRMNDKGCTFDEIANKILSYKTV